MLAVCSFWCACTISEKIRPPSERRVVDVDKWPLAAIKSRLKEGHGRADDCSLVPLAQRKSVLMAGTCTQSVPWATRRPHVLLAPLHPSVHPLPLLLHSCTQPRVMYRFRTNAGKHRFYFLRIKWDVWFNTLCSRGIFNHVFVFIFEIPFWFARRCMDIGNGLFLWILLFLILWFMFFFAD